LPSPHPSVVTIADICLVDDPKDNQRQWASQRGDYELVQEYEWEFRRTTCPEPLHQSSGLDGPLRFFMLGKVKIVVASIVSGEDDPITCKAVGVCPFDKTFNEDSVGCGARPDLGIMTIPLAYRIQDRV
jgi:hypothetical protein